MWGKPFPQDRPRSIVGRDRRGVRIVAVRARQGLSPAQPYPGDWGTAVNVQAMVFGNMGETSATGVAFTRDPSTARPPITASS
ncbi:MAG: PEP/pyruvate-binding domain-containing protein [Sphingomonas sp.]